LFREDKKTDKKIPSLLAFFLSSILLVVIFTGCFTQEHSSQAFTETILPEVKLDQSSVLPNWTDGEYHDYFGTRKILNSLNEKYPDLVKVFSIGKSVLGKDIWCIRITNENNNQEKLSCLIDGCIHGDEWEAGEACLYLTEYLLINFDANKTITQILNSSEVYIVPFVNPDGREANERFTDNGVDPNRNFDVFFGKLRGKSFRLGKLFGKIKIPVIKFFSKDPTKYLWNCGKFPFSEPETQAMRDLIKNLNKQDLSFYVNCHTALHTIAMPWLSYKPPFEMTSQEKRVFDDIVIWVHENTEYESFRGEGYEYKAGGIAMDWVFKEFRIPSFTFEICSPDYDPWLGGNHDHLVHWMKTTLPFFIYLLINIDNLRQWKTPDIQPPLPEGVPPEPLK